jgi:uncharacterized protein YjiS (DUF1127 family)
MTFLPDIIPADPRDPESVHHQMRPVKYGILGKIIMAADAARERRELAKLGNRLLADIGLNRIDANRDMRPGRWHLADLHRSHVSPMPRPGLF